MSRERPPRIPSLALGLFRRLTMLMPLRYRRHRAEAVDLMAQLADAAYRERGTLGLVAVTASAMIDLIVVAPAHHLRTVGAALRRDVPHAIRSLGRRPMSSAAEIATLAIGVGLNAAVFSVVDWVLLRPLAYPAPHELVSMSAAGRTPSPSGGDMSYGEFDLASRATSLRASAAFSKATRVVAGPGLDPTHVVVARMAGDLFATLGVRPDVGRAIERRETADGAPVAVVSDALWRSHFMADPAVVGHAITIDRQPLTIVGVMPRGLGYPRDADLWRPYTLAERDDNDRELTAIGRLAPERSADQAVVELSTLARGASLSAGGVRVENLQRSEVHDVRAALVALFVSSAFVLLMACANVAALVGARGRDRAGEMAVRAALGAGRSTLIQQLLTEYLLLAAAGGAAGLVLGRWALDLLIALAPAGLPRLAEITLDSRIVVAGGIATVGVGLLIGVAPAFGASSVELRGALAAATSSRTAGRARGRRLLVAGQTAAALVLAVTAVLLGRSLQHLVQTPHGFDADRLVAVDLYLRGGVTNDVRGLYSTLVDAAEAIPSVRAAAVSLRLPTQIASLRTAVRLEGTPSRTPPVAFIRPITRRYFETTGIPIASGRAFAATDRRSSARVAIVNAAFVRDILGGAPALDVRLSLDVLNATVSIVGVAADVTPGGERDRPAVYVSLDQVEVPGGFLLVRADGDLQPVMTALTARLKSVAPALARDRIHRVADDVGEQRSGARFNAQVVSSFAALALILAIIGVYGLTAGEIADRRRELAVRMALGASRRDVLVTAVWPGAAAILAGIALGLAATLAAGRGIASLLHGVTPADPETLIAVPVVLTAVGLAASLAAAARVIRANPARALHAE